MNKSDIVKIGEVIEYLLLGHDIWLNSKTYLQMEKDKLYQFTETKNQKWEKKELEGTFFDFIKLFLAIDEKELLRLWMIERQTTFNLSHNQKLELES